MAITWVAASNFAGLPAPVIGQFRGGVPGAADYEASIGTGTAAGELTQTGQFTWVNGAAHPFTYTFDAVLNRVRLTLGAGAGQVAIQHVHPTPLTPERVFLLAVTRALTQFTRWTNLAITATATAEVAALPDVISTGNATAALLISGPFLSGFMLTGRFGFQWTGAMPLRSELLGMAKVVDGDATWIPDEPRPRRRDPVFGYLLAFLMEDARRGVPIIGRGGDEERRRRLGLSTRGSTPP
jgi:hypothetical protein